METKGFQQFINSYSVKMVIVSALAVVLLIPSFLLQEVIRERSDRSKQVKEDLRIQWGGRQVVAGPVLNVPFTVSGSNDKSPSTDERRGIAHFLPETIQTDGVLTPEIRKRGIYPVPVYEGQIRLKGTFSKPDGSLLEIQNATYDWGAAYFTIGISDMRGIRNLPELIVNGQSCKVEPGVADTDLFESGITIKTGALDLMQSLTFDIVLVLNGSDDLSVQALGKTSEISLKSDWPQPSFSGNFLPENRTITADGFTANWRVTHLNRNFPQQWVDDKYHTQDSELGVALLIPVDHYQKAMRSAKYAILFIALNFLVFLFIEIRSRIRIHPFQYSLIAFALLLFYALLISIGEQTGFNWAYLISATAVTLLVSWYTHNLLGDKRLTLWITLLQTGLYIFLFTLLQLQDYALLAGSIGLFVILVIVMRASRKIQWYSEE